jgi:hypothetical protein
MMNRDGYARRRACLDVSPCRTQLDDHVAENVPNLVSRYCQYDNGDNCYEDKDQRIFD